MPLCAVCNPAIAKICSVTDLSVEETVEEGGEEALKWDEEVGEETPDSQVEAADILRRRSHLDGVGDPQQWL